MGAGNTDTAMVLAMAFPETEAMPFRSTDADHTDIKMDIKTDTDSTTDMTLDMEIPDTQDGTQITTHTLRIRAIIITPIQHGHTRRSALGYSNRMAGKVSSLLRRKLWPDEP